MFLGWGRASNTSYSITKRYNYYTSSNEGASAVSEKMVAQTLGAVLKFISGNSSLIARFSEDQNLEAENILPHPTLENVFIDVRPSDQNF